MDLQILHKIFRIGLWEIVSQNDQSENYDNSCFTHILNKQKFSKETVKKSTENFKSEIEELVLEASELKMDAFDLNLKIARLIADDLAKNRLERNELLDNKTFTICLD